MTTPCEKIGSKSCGWVWSGRDTRAEANSGRAEVHLGKRRVLPLKLGCTYHSCFQPAFVAKSKQLLTKKDIGCRRRLRQRPQRSFDHWHSLLRRHLTDTRQPCGTGSNRRSLGGTLNRSFQDTRIYRSGIFGQDKELRLPSAETNSGLASRNLFIINYR
jgi:hypothetical protein